MSQTNGMQWEFRAKASASMPHLDDKNVLLKLYNLLQNTPAASGSWNFYTIIIYYFLVRPMCIEFVFKIVYWWSMSHLCWQTIFWCSWCPMGLLPSWNVTLAVLRCAVRQYSLRLTLPTRPTKIGNQSLIAGTELCLCAVYSTRCISDVWRIEVTGASVLKLSAGLLQCYTSRNSADNDKRLQSLQNTAAHLVSGTIFWDHYH